MTQTNIKRGDVFWVDLDPAKHTEIQKTRPCLIISNDIMNENYTRVIVAPITSNIKKIYPFDYKLQENENLKGKVLLHQIRTVDKNRLGKKIGSLLVSELIEIDSIIELVLGIKK
jgi:mRNA interferase MazF